MKRGFTLVELLGIIIIITALTLIALPKITNLVNSSKNKTDKLTEDMITQAASLYVSENESSFAKIDGNRYCITLRTLVDNGYLKSPITTSKNNHDITDNKEIQVRYNDDYIYEIVNIGSCVEGIDYAYLLEKQGYQMVEYIESTGTQYIDTGVKSGTTLKFEIVAKINNVLNSGNYAFFGGWTDSKYAQLCINSNINGWIVQWSANNWDYYGTKDNNKHIHVLDLMNSKYIVDNTTYNITSDIDASSNANIYLFATNNSNTVSRLTSLTLYSFIAYENGTLIRNMIPCYEKLNPTNVGMYDIVNNVFYSNQGTDNFIAGPEIN